MASFMNEAPWDRALRVLVGLFLLYLGWSGAVAGTLGWILKIGGFLPLATGIIGWCALYQLLDFSTCSPRPTRGAV